MTMPRTRRNFPHMKQRGRRHHARIRMWDSNWHCTFDSWQKGAWKGITLDFTLTGGTLSIPTRKAPQ